METRINGSFYKRIFTRPMRFALAAVILLFIGSGLWLVFKPAPPSVTVDYIDVGQAGVVGDSILVRSSEGKVALIDGGFPNSGVLPYLQARNITHIDLIVVSHPHDDHTGGLSEVLRSIPADRLVSNGQPLDSPIYADLQNAIRDSGIQADVVKAGDKLSFGRLAFQVLSPRKINPQTINDNSIVLRLVVGKVAFLFTGDMQKLDESRLLSINAPVQADIFKIAHHGATTSSSAAFIERVHPAVAIYSAGKGNKYGFPEQQTLDTLLSYGIRIYGTDRNGAITVTTDGKTYTVSAERGEPLEPGQ